MINILSIAVGGAIGSVLRYTVQKSFHLSFPLGTLSANIIGCFFAGCIWASFGKTSNQPLYLFLMTGFCGGFTTFSAFSVESVQMLNADRWFSFSLYIMASVVGGLLATFSGYKIFS